MFNIKSLAKLVVAVFGLTLLAVPSFAQVTGVEGDVKGPDGAPLVGATVHFERTDIKGNYTVKTNKKGHYGHYGLPLGTYNVTLEVDGKVIDSVKGFRTKLGDPTQLPFSMKESAQKQQEVQKAVETGTLTKEQERGMTKEQKAEMEKNIKAKEAALAKNKALNDAFQAGKAAMEKGVADKGTPDKAAADYQEAVDQFKKASEMDATQNVIWAQLADAYIQMASVKPAEGEALRQQGFDAYKKAIELKPDEAAYYNNYALALAKSKKLDEAKQNLDKAAQLDPAGAGRYYYNMGALLVNSNQNEAAGEEFKKAITLDPNYADAQYQYGLFLASKATADAKGNIVAQPGTLEALNKYLELKPDGGYAQNAKDLIAQLGGKIDTSYSNPSAPAKKSTTTTKKKQ